MNNSTNLTYYQRNRDVVLNKAKDYYENRKEKLREQARDKYRNLSEEEKLEKREYAKNRYHNMSEEGKQKLKEYQKEYQKNCHEAKKIIRYTNHIYHHQHRQVCFQNLSSLAFQLFPILYYNFLKIVYRLL